MPFTPPTALVLDHGALIVLRQVLVSAEPDEGCALLLGSRSPERDSGTLWQIRRIWPCLNNWPERPDRRRRFAIDPREQLLAQKWGRSRQLEVLGAAHSHPGGEAVPSATDAALTLAPALMLILGASGELAAWWLTELHTQPQRLAWRMDD